MQDGKHSIYQIVFLCRWLYAGGSKIALAWWTSCAHQFGWNFRIVSLIESIESFYRFYHCKNNYSIICLVENGNRRCWRLACRGNNKVWFWSFSTSSMSSTKRLAWISSSVWNCFGLRMVFSDTTQWFSISVIQWSQSGLWLWRSSCSIIVQHGRIVAWSSYWFVTVELNRVFLNSIGG